ncbi:MAG: gliding motility-associated C-terminal domain-containing protein, partial [Bacteroidota bacterium]|nr:gliding motility-associated C-terminal domain-containing protein [Bacteroidota bacterium]
PVRRTVTIVTDNNQICNTTLSINVTIYPSPKSAIEAYTIAGRPEIVVYKSKSILSDSCDWELSDGTHRFNTDSIVQQYGNNGLYRILLKNTNMYGCTDTVSLMHRTLLTGLFVPNAFRPESPDYKVNTFKPVGMGLKSFYMGIYDLWGNLIWQTQSENNPEILEGWNGRSKNGTPLPVGVYIWRIKAIFEDGTEWKGNQTKNGFYSTEGNVTLLR